MLLDDGLHYFRGGIREERCPVYAKKLRIVCWRLIQVSVKRNFYHGEEGQCWVWRCVCKQSEKGQQTQQRI